MAATSTPETELTKARFAADALGRWSEEQVFEVTRERITAYAEATNDPIEAHLQGRVAPPVFAVVPTFLALAPAALEVAPVELLGRLVHGEQDFVFHRPILPGDVLTARARPVGYAALRTGSTVTVHCETRDAAGELVNEQWLAAFFRGIDAGDRAGEQAPQHALPADLTLGPPVARVDQRVDEDQTFRYSPASGDPMPIHLDDEIARLSGLPGIINHGLCTMAFTSWAVLREFAGGDTARLRRLAVRFARPVLPGQEISTRFWRLPQSQGGQIEGGQIEGGQIEGGQTVGFETSVERPEGDPVLVIRDGLAVLTD